jgi:hypothetical protein
MAQVDPAHEAFGNALDNADMDFAFAEKGRRATPPAFFD